MNADAIFADHPGTDVADLDIHRGGGDELHRGGGDDVHRDDHDEDRPPEGDPARKSVATQLVELATEVYDVSLADDGSVFAVPRSGPRLVYPLRGGRSSLRSALAGLYFTRTGRAASQQALTDALMILDGQGQQTDPATLHLRVAEADDAWWLDLGDQTGRAIRVTATGWSLAGSAPVLFRRSALTGALPEPVRGGQLGELWELLNVSAADRPLVLAWLVAVLLPDVAHPILGLFGEQGAGKTTAGRILGGLLDPSPVPVRKAPRDAESWVTAASGSWIVALDNLSTMPDWLSDTLSRAVTSEGDVRRQLYTDGDLIVYAFRRCLIVTSIDLGAAKGDFGDRLLPIDLDPISETERVTDRALWPRWDRAHPRVLAAVLDVAASVARVLPTVALSTHARMADFMEVLAAVDQVTGSAGLDRYRRKVYSLAAETLTGDPFVSAVRAALVTGETWEGTSAELLALATPEDERWRAPKGWPSNARQVTTQLRRQAPVMRKAGWTADDLGAGNQANAVRWQLAVPREKACNQPSPDSPDSQAASDASLARHEYAPSPSDPGTALCPICGAVAWLDDDGVLCLPCRSGSRRVS